MNVRLNIDPDCSEACVVITAPQLTPQVEQIYQMIANHESAGSPRMLIGYTDNQAIPLQLSDIVRLYTEDRQVFARTPEGTMRIRMKMKELEALLQPQGFVRINQGEIVNIAHIERMDLSMVGSIAVRLVDGTACFVSRRSLKAFRTAMGL